MDRLIYLAIMFTFLGFLFKILHWQFANELLILAALPIVIYCVYRIIKG